MKIIVFGMTILCGLLCMIGALCFNTLSAVDFYRNCFWVCLIGMLLFGILAVLICFLFHIPTEVAKRLGSKQNQTSTQTEEMHFHPYKTAQTKAGQTAFLNEEDAFVIEKDIVLSEVRSRQKRRDE